jgi:hypothetical protein
VTNLGDIGEDGGGVKSIGTEEGCLGGVPPRCRNEREINGIRGDNVILEDTPSPHRFGTERAISLSSLAFEGLPWLMYCPRGEGLRLQLGECPARYSAWYSA